MNKNLLSVVSPIPIYHGCFTLKTFWEEVFTPVNMKKRAVAILGKTGKSRIVISISPWTSL